MKETTKYSKHYYDYDRNDLNRTNPFTDLMINSNQEFLEHDRISMLGNPGTSSPDTLNFNYTMSDDTISFNTEDNMPPWGHSDMEALGSIDLNLDATSRNGFWKYEEDLTMKEVREYLSGTYKAHYTSKDSKTQTLDLIEAIGDAEPFCRSNAIKYLSRFGKKGGKSKMDILKAIHYCVLLYHFSGLHNEIKESYETF
jgi:hypothetical protein